MGDWATGFALQAERLASDASPQAQSLGRQLLRCIECNLLARDMRCDQCPAATTMSRFRTIPVRPN